MLIRRVQYAQAYGEQIKTSEGRRKIKKKPKPRRSNKIFFLSLKKVGNVGEIMITKKSKTNNKKKR